MAMGSSLSREEVTKVRVLPAPRESIRSSQRHDASRQRFAFRQCRGRFFVIRLLSAGEAFGLGDTLAVENADVHLRSIGGKWNGREAENLAFLG